MKKSITNKPPTVAAELAAQWQQLAISRSNIYGLLALIYRDVPAPDTISLLKEPKLAKTLESLGFNFTETLSGDIEKVTDSLALQYTRTFIGPGPHISPYASVHLEKDSQLWGDSTVWVKKFIDATGLTFTENAGGIPDHIAIELELMQRLADHQALLCSQILTTSKNSKTIEDQLAKCIDAQKKFLDEHLNQWAPMLCEKILNASDSQFYQKVAKLTLTVISADIDHINTIAKILK